MKKWQQPEIKTLDITDTAHSWMGIYRDGGYIGDGEISGHLSWTAPTSAPRATNAPTAEPTVTSVPNVNVLSGE